MHGNIRGFLHLYIGEEAIAAGAVSAMRPEDVIYTHYRDHGHAIARGLEPKRIMAELFGKQTGVSGGKGGSMHLFDPSLNFMGGYAIVAGHLPLSVGHALANQYLEKDGVIVTFFGDGALAEGEFHEAMNLAAVWHLPVLFLCENNLYGMGAAANEVFAAASHLHKIVDPYGIPSKAIDGMDVEEVRSAVGRALEEIRAGKGPQFIEARCYRFQGHSVADPNAYREKSEESEWRERDPVTTFRARLSNDGVSAETLDDIDKQAEELIDEAVEFARQSAPPDASKLYSDILGDSAERA